MARSITAVAGNSSRNRAVLMLAAVFGLLSAVLVFAFLSGQGGGDSADRALSPSDGAESVVVVSRNVNVGEKISADMLTTRTLPKSLVLAGGAAKAEDLVGKVATTPLFAGEQVLLAKVTSFEGQNTVAYKVPDGMRAISVQVPHE
ncbi:MAG: Flp pilus assembly protein CpaB, partial [Chloroflexi bacterium CFX7]|nr:Flp pilus assembly protein CpaB [Chloroflexi bacterium CFX7]